MEDLPGAIRALADYGVALSTILYLLITCQRERQQAAKDHRAERESMLKAHREERDAMAHQHREELLRLGRDK